MTDHQAQARVDQVLREIAEQPDKLRLIITAALSAAEAEALRQAERIKTTLILLGMEGSDRLPLIDKWMRLKGRAEAAETSLDDLRKSVIDAVGPVDDLDKLPVEVSVLALQIETLESRVRDLEAGLRPFAEFAPEAEGFVIRAANTGELPVMPTKHFRLADFRRARALLSVTAAERDGLLWCCHVRGPDDMVPTASYAEALDLADRLLQFDRRPDRHECDPFASAVPALWPYGASAHAEEMAKRKLPNADYPLPAPSAPPAEAGEAP